MARRNLRKVRPANARARLRRLRLIAVEDVGTGLPMGSVLIDVLHRNFKVARGGNWLMACHAVRVLAFAPKDRTSSEHADWVATKVAAGEAAGAENRFSVLLVDPQ